MNNLIINFPKTAKTNQHQWVLQNVVIDLETSVAIWIFVSYLTNLPIKTVFNLQNLSLVDYYDANTEWEKHEPENIDKYLKNIPNLLS